MFCRNTFCSSGALRLLRPAVRAFVYLCLLMYASREFCVAQQTNASLAGVVVDAGGAGVPNATVVVTNVSTGVSRTTTADGQGNYLVVDLIPDSYKVTTSHDGFDTKVMNGIVLQVGQAATLQIALTVGSVSTTVMVSTAAAATDTESASQGSVIDTRKIIGLPLNQRTFYSLPLLSPGVEMPGQNSTLGFRGGFNVAGNEETSNTFTVNGIDDNDQDVMAPSFRPSVEAIQEFNILTGVYSAEYGRTQGGQVVVVTKSGGNEFHGDAFEFIRNQVTDAKNYFTLPGTTPGFRRNQFGGILGGPIIKNRTFFFVSYEQMALAQQVSATSTVPTLAERSGNFAGAATIHNPYSGLPFTMPNQIPSSMISPYGQALINLYPTPNNGSGLANNFLFDETRIENNYVFGLRIDHTISPSDSLVGQYNYFNDPSFEPSNSLCGSATLPGFGCTTNQRSTLAGVNWIHIFNQNLVNEFRAGYDRLVQPRLQQDYTNTSFPMLANVFDDPSIANNFGSPDTSISGFTSLAPYGNLPQTRWDNHYNLVDNLSWTHGTHTIKAGVNLLQARYSNSYVVDGRGALSFNSSSTLAAGGPTTGNSLADVLFGLAYSSSRESTAPLMEMRYGSYGAFVEDTWRMSRDLTLTPGLRYEYFTPLTDANNRIATYDQATQTMLQAGAPGVGKNVYQSDLNNVEPRFGLAWQPFHKPDTVFHASTGMFYNSPPIGNGAGLSLLANAPMRAPQTFYTTKATPLQLDTNPFPGPAGCTLEQIGLTANCPLTIAPTGIQRNFRTMYVLEYAADIQQQLANGLVLTVGYLGSEGSKLPNEVNLNQPLVIDGVSESARPVLGVHGITYPSPHFYTYNNISFYESGGKSYFNSMQVKLQQTYQHGLSLILAYTWSKSLDNTPGYASTSQSSALLPQNSYDPQAEKGLSDFNVSQRFVLSPVYDLPLGKGKQFLSDGLASKIVGGWQLSGIGTVQTGRPFTVTNSNLNNSGSFNNEDRPNLVGNPNTGPKTIAKWFNTAAFSTAVTPKTFGDAGRNIVIGPGYVDVDMAIQRTFQLTERVAMPLRFESFNIANKPNFYNPYGASLQAGTSSFGSITQANDPREMQASVKFVF
jgi:hypothetical protein